MLTTVEKLDLKDLREQTVKICARKMPIAELELQKKSIDNEELANNTYMEVLRYNSISWRYCCHKNRQIKRTDILDKIPVSGIFPMRLS